MHAGGYWLVIRLHARLERKLYCQFDSQFRLVVVFNVGFGIPIRSPRIAMMMM